MAVGHKVTWSAMDDPEEFSPKTGRHFRADDPAVLEIWRRRLERYSRTEVPDIRVIMRMSEPDLEQIRQALDEHREQVIQNAAQKVLKDIYRKME